MHFKKLVLVSPWVGLLGAEGVGHLIILGYVGK